MKIIFRKTLTVRHRKMPKNHLFFSWENPAKKSNNFHPYLLQAQPAVDLLLLACYYGSTTMGRRNDICVDPNQTDS